MRYLSVSMAHTRYFHGPFTANFYFFTTVSDRLVWASNRDENMLMTTNTFQKYLNGVQYELPNGVG